MGLSETVSSVKKKVEKELDVPCELQRLVFKGSPLTGNMISNVRPMELRLLFTVTLTLES